MDIFNDDIFFFKFQNLIKKEDICNGPELKEFLAYEGDAHIAFVRKAPEINVPRIDKVGNFLFTYF